VIVGSAIVRRLETSAGGAEAALKSVEDFAKSMVTACHGA
jgi:tryptophan synthase alpha subunit